MQVLYDQLSRVAPTSATVMLIGDSGTGKELAAATVHELSRRRDAAFLPLNCGAVAPQLIESELFGHERGSFTGADRQHKGFFERANGGTIFLDEITEMPMELQVKLLRVLETAPSCGWVAPRQSRAMCALICATNREPEKAVADGKLREDLYHRSTCFPSGCRPCATVERTLSSWRSSPGRSQQDRKYQQDVLARCAGRLYQHPWPGNVRELKNYVQRTYIMADDIIEFDVAVSETTPNRMTARRLPFVSALHWRKSSVA